MRGAIVRIAFFVAVCLAVPIFFEGVNVFCRARFSLEGNSMLWDEAFLAFDEWVLGSFFPRGQLALFVMENEYIGPLSLLGRLSAEVLQIMYAR